MTDPSIDLKLSDRCDTGCTAQAIVGVTLPTLAEEGPIDGLLLFCLHHYKKYEDALERQGATVVVDIRDTINAKAGASA